MTDIRIIRRLTALGLNEFWAHIEGCREDKKNGIPSRPLPPSLLNGNAQTEQVAGSISIDLAVTFATRFEFANYAADRMRAEWKDEFADDIGLWAWLAVAYWPQFTSKGVRRQEHYIPLLGAFAGRFGPQRLDYRQCARTPVLLVRRLGTDAKLFLAGPAGKPRSMGEMGDFVEQILSRQDVMGSRRFLEVLKHLYADESGFEKVGSTAAPKKKKLRNGQWSRSGRGGARRLVMGMLPRLKLTYHVDELSAAMLVQLAGPEFATEAD